MPKRTRTTRRLEAWLKDTDLALFVLNAQRRLVFFNRGCETLTGWTAADVLGQQCHYASESDPLTAAALLGALAPPPEAWTGKLQQAPTGIPRRSEPPVPRVIHYFPLVDGPQEVQAMLGVIADSPPAPLMSPLPATQRLHAELAALRQAVRRRYGEGNLVGRSPAMNRVFEQIRLAQAGTAPVVFVGEAGVGKQHLARALHYQGAFGKKAFVPLDSRIRGDELEQILARIRDDDDVLGAGALFLERLDTAPADFQQVLADWMAREPRPRLRVIASTPRDLLPLVEADRFSRTLYFQLTSLVIDVPPLRERPEDLELLAQYFLEELNRTSTRQVGGFADDVLRSLRRYNWPGNVAELRQVVHEARDACPEAVIRTEHLPFRFRTGVTAQSMEPRQRLIQPLDQLLEQVERDQIERALAECRQNKARAAELLQITRPRLYRRMELLGIADPESTLPLETEAEPGETSTPT